MDYIILLSEIESHIQQNIDEVGAIPYFLTVTFPITFDPSNSPITRSNHSILRSFEYCCGCLMNTKILLGNNYKRLFERSTMNEKTLEGVGD